MAIRILPDTLVNQIAAGEVIERPAAVVKELLENALDAQSTDIQTEIEAGGKRLIRVSDNGTGMTPEDVRLAIQRHATSKIATADDLTRIHTFGFRGEALPSIAAVSHMEILTRPESAIEGTRLTLEAGKLVRFEPAGCAPGTRVSVRHLFHNVPARLKFLKSDTSEFRALVNQVTWAALAHPDVRFQLTHNGRKTLDVPVCRSITERIRLLYGKEMADNLLEFENEVPGFRIHGFLSKPEYTKANRNYQLFFLNKRPIRSRLLIAALNEVMRSYIPRERYAVAFLFITMSADDVDVNVHPAKTEVRFRNERSVYSQLVRGLHQGIYQQKYIPQVRQRVEREEPAVPVDVPEGMQDPQTFTSLPSKHPRDIHPWSSAAVPTPAFTTGTTFSSPSSESAEVHLFDMQHVQVKASLFNTYILAEAGDTILFIDQHVASERVLYERYVQQLQSQGIPVQSLLLPLTLELAAEQMQVFHERQSEIAMLGFEAEDFGGNTLLIRALPAELNMSEAEGALRDILDRLSADGESAPALPGIQDQALITLACHSAIRAGDALTVEQMAHLLRELSCAQLPFNCPHARPIVVRMSKLELDNRFKRR